MARQGKTYRLTGKSCHAYPVRTLGLLARTFFVGPAVHCLGLWSGGLGRIATGAATFGCPIDCSLECRYIGSALDMRLGRGGLVEWELRQG